MIVLHWHALSYASFRPIRDPPSGDGEANIGHSGDSASLSPSTQAQYCFSGCLANKRLVSHNLLRPTAYTSPLATAQIR